MTGRLLFSCYNLQILEHQTDGITNFNANIRSSGRYVITGFSEFQCQIIDLFWQKKITPIRGNYNWHDNCVYQSDLMWENKDVMQTVLKDWLSLNHQPILKHFQTDKLSVINSLDLTSELNTPLNRIDEKKVPNLALASFICQESGIIMIAKLHLGAIKAELSNLWERFINQTDCAIVFHHQKPTSLKSDIANIF